jgi:hypothetical protein
MRTVLVALALIASVAADAQTPPPPGPQENTGANANIARWARGQYVYRAGDGRERGREWFQLFVYGDGSRQVLAWHDLFATNTQFTTFMRVDARMAPLEAFAQFWTQGKFKGAAAITFADGRMNLVSTGPQGTTTQTQPTPAEFSISLHPVATDWWHYWYYDLKKGGSQISRYYSLEAGRDLGLPVTARMIETEQAAAGEEEVTVPAGTFRAMKYTSGASAAWLTGPDMILVKSVSGRGNDYVLQSLERGP